MKTTPPDSPGTQPRSAQPRRCPPSLRLQQGQSSHHNTCNVILYLKQYVWIDLYFRVGIIFRYDSFRYAKTSS